MCMRVYEVNRPMAPRRRVQTIAGYMVGTVSHSIILSSHVCGGGNRREREREREREIERERECVCVCVCIC